MLNLSVLMENTAAEGFACEHGLSFLLDSGDTAILFDTGQSGGFLDNAAKMGCDLGTVTHVTLSHGHFDHTGGLAPALRHIREKKNGKGLPPVVAHPGVLAHRRRPPSHTGGDKYLGMPDDARSELANWPRMFSETPLKIREDIVYLGEIPHKHPELCALVGVADCGEGYEKDMLPDDSALVYVTGKGLVVVAGCSHSGIINILEYAKTVTGVSTVRAVYGGLHCKDMTSECVEKTRTALEKENLKELYACHCTGGALDGFPGQIRLRSGERHVIID